MRKNYNNFIVKVKNQENSFYAGIYSLAKKVKNFSLPHNKYIHSFLYNEWVLRTGAWHSFWQKLYYTPMFKSQCAAVGENFRMEYAGNGSAKVFGNLQLTIGDNVTIFDNTVFVGLRVKENPTLEIGDNTYIGPLVNFFVGAQITIGKHCFIASEIITDNPGHSLDVIKRMQPGAGPPDAQNIKPIVIGDYCLFARRTFVYPGVTVGDGVVARMGTHIDRDVPPFCQVGGNPMRIIRKIRIPEEFVDIVGEERMAKYRDEQAKIELD